MKRGSLAFGATELRRYDMPDGTIMRWGVLAQWNLGPNPLDTLRRST
jgi:hypothetical protein